jgi:hypothetical protein
MQSLDLQGHTEGTYCCLLGKPGDILTAVFSLIKVEWANFFKKGKLLYTHLFPYFHENL